MTHSGHERTAARTAQVVKRPEGDGMRTDVVLVKLGAAVIVVTAVGNFQTYVSMILGRPWWIPAALIAVLFAVVLPALIAFVFWRFPNTVVGMLDTSSER